MKKLATLAGVGLLISAGFVLWLMSINRPEFSEIRRAPRPHADEAAVAYSIDAGATVAFGYAVHLQSGKDAAKGKRGPELWNSYRIEPVRVQWAGRDTLLVFVDSEPSYKWSIQQHNRRGIRMRTVWVEEGDSTSRP